MPRPPPLHIHNLFDHHIYQNLTRILRTTGNRAWGLGGKFNLGRESFCERFHRLRTVKLSLSFRRMEWGHVDFIVAGLGCRDSPVASDGVL